MMLRNVPTYCFNGSFEANAGLNNGNNFVLPDGWQITAGIPNIVLVDGLNGAYEYGRGGPEFDADGGAGHYFDIDGDGSVYQTFTVTETTAVVLELMLPQEILELVMPKFNYLMAVA